MVKEKNKRGRKKGSSAITPRHRKLRATIGQFKTEKEWLLNAGYTEKVARSPAGVKRTRGYQIIMKDYLDNLKKTAENIAKEMASRALNEERFSELGSTLNNVQKQVLLLEGKPTENTKILIDEETRGKVDEAIDSL